MRIVHALAPAPVGGLERVVEMLAASQADAGHDVTVIGSITPGAGPHPFFEALHSAGLDPVAIEIPDRRWGAEVRGLLERLRELSPDVVHTHGYRADVLAGIAAARARLPRVSTAHGFTGGDAKNRLYERLQVLSYRREGRVVSVSEPLRDELAARGVPESQLHLIRNAWRPSGAPLGRASARGELGLGADEVVVGFVGRMGAEKGPDVALAALPDLPGVRLCMVGDGSLRTELEGRAAALDVADRVTWTGWVQEAGRLLEAFDVLVLSSRTEGTPIILLEALAAGVPIVATRVGGVPDVVRDGIEALLVPSEDSAALARVVRQCLEDPGSTARRVDQGSVRLDSDFSAPKWVERYERVYMEAIEER